MSLAVAGAIAIQVNIGKLQVEADRVDQEQPLTSDEVCNSGWGEQQGPFSCQDGKACLNVVPMIRQICGSCRKKGHITSGDEEKCIDIAGNQYRHKVKGVKVWCSGQSDDGTACAAPVLGSTGYLNWGHFGALTVCPCVKQFIEDCAGKGVFCALNKVQQCPKVCNGFKSRLQAAQDASALVEDTKDGESSLMEATSEDELNKRARVSVDARGKTSRNASASIMSLDNSMSGKCSQ